MNRPYRELSKAHEDDRKEDKPVSEGRSWKKWSPRTDQGEKLQKQTKSETWAGAMRCRALRTEADFDAQHNEEPLKWLKEATV